MRPKLLFVFILLSTQFICHGQDNEFKAESSSAVQQGSNNEQTNKFDYSCEISIVNLGVAVYLPDGYIQDVQSIIDHIPSAHPCRDSISKYLNLLNQDPYNLKNHIQYSTIISRCTKELNSPENSLPNFTVKEILDYSRLGCSPNVQKLTSEKGKVYFVSKSNESSWITKVFPKREGIRRIQVKSGEYGYTANDSSFLILPIYKEAYDFSDGLALVRNGDEYRFLNKNGDLALIPPRPYEKVFPFNEGVALIKIDYGNYNFIDKAGSYVFEKNFREAKGFTCGVAAVKVGFIGGYPKWERRKLSHKIYPVNYHSEEGIEDYAYGFINHDGKFSIIPKYYSASKFTKDSIAAVAISYNKHIFIKYNGEFLSSTYEHIEPINDYLFLARTFGGFFSRRNVLIFNSEYKPIHDYVDHISYSEFDLFIFQEDNRHGVFDSRGLVIVPPKYQKVDVIGRNVFQVQKDGRSYPITVDKQSLETIELPAFED